jgi:hypothetical protein
MLGQAHLIGKNSNTKASKQLATRQLAMIIKQSRIIDPP